MSTSIYNTIRRIESDTARINFERGQKNLGSDRLDKQAFMQLLMAKLKYQNPLDPIKDADFLNQQTMLAQVEKLDDLSKVLQNNSQLAQASSLVGKRVDVNELDGSTTTGTIQSISFSKGVASLSINGKDYDMSQISKIHSG